MPARSKSQQRAAAIALAVKKGKMPASSLSGASRKMYESMSTKQLEEYAKTKRKGLPNRKKVK